MEPRPGGAGAPGVGASARPLGRGLEHVSRVFLTQQSAEKVADPGGERPLVRPLPRGGSGPGALLLRPIAHITREQVAAALKDFAEALEDGLRQIDADLPCAPCGEIDLLAVDRANQLTIIDFDTAAGDELLVRGLGHVAWAQGNVPNLRRMFRGQPINFSMPPRLLLLAPQFSSRVRCAAGPTQVTIDWVRYHVVESPGRVGILFERLPPE